MTVESQLREQLAKQEQELASRLKAHSEFAFEMDGLVAERDKRIAELEAQKDAERELREKVETEIADLDAAMHFNSHKETEKRILARTPEHARRAVVDAIEDRAIRRHLSRTALSQTKEGEG